MFNEIDIKLLKRLITYDYNTGKAFWKKRDKEYFYYDNRTLNTWNSKFAGTEIKSLKDGYYVFRHEINGVKYRIKLHRVIFAYHHGYWPNDLLDHKDGNKINNKIDNIILSNKSENAKNSKPKSGSGYKNITWEPRINRWSIRFRVSAGHNISGGSYKNIEDAVKARNELFLIYNHPPARDNPNWEYIREKEGNQPLNSPI